ncbi:MAG: glycosyltransferase family 4 protein [Halioglobus sp.]
MPGQNKKVVVLGAQVPFVRGGAEILNDSLVDAINTRLDGVQAELVQLPFKWYPEAQLIKDMAAWRMVDLSETNGNKIDLCIATKFPTYVAQHDNKVTWLVHQHRVFYDLEGSEFDVPHCSETDKVVRQKVRSTDAGFLKESKAIYTISGTVSDRLLQYNRVASEPIYPPPKLAEQIHHQDYGDYILYIGRVERIKRIKPLLDALVQIKSAKARIVGTGEYVQELKDYARAQGIADRCIFEGYVSDERYLELLAHCKAVYYGPVGEDYGFATIEALLAHKPVLTLADSGEVARIVDNTGAGFIAADTEELAQHIESVLSLSKADLAHLVNDGHAMAKEITWDGVLSRLILPYL